MSNTYKNSHLRSSSTSHLTPTWLPNKLTPSEIPDPSNFEVMNLSFFAKCSHLPSPAEVRAQAKAEHLAGINPDERTVQDGFHDLHLCCLKTWVYLSNGEATHICQRHGACMQLAGLSGISKRFLKYMVGIRMGTSGSFTWNMFKNKLWSSMGHNGTRWMKRSLLLIPSEPKKATPSWAGSSRPIHR